MNINEKREIEEKQAQGDNRIALRLYGGLFEVLLQGDIIGIIQYSCPYKVWAFDQIGLTLDSDNIWRQIEDILYTLNNR